MRLLTPCLHLAGILSLAARLEQTGLANGNGYIYVAYGSGTFLAQENGVNPPAPLGWPWSR